MAISMGRDDVMNYVVYAYLSSLLRTALTRGVLTECSKKAPSGPVQTQEHLQSYKGSVKIIQYQM